MATVKILLNIYKKSKRGDYPLVVQVIKFRKKKIIYLDKRIEKQYWDFNKNTLKRNHPYYKSLYSFIIKKKLEIEEKILEIEERNPECTIDEIVDYLKNNKSIAYVFWYWEKTINMLFQIGKNGNANAYKNTYFSFKKFRKNKDLSFNELNYSMVKKYENFLLENGVQTNGISFHMRTLRALYNRAIKDDIANKSNYPFEKYSIKREKTIHRALSKEEMKKIRDVVLDDKSLIVARDYFMFSFYTQGMSFIDIALLKVKNLHNSRLQYRRAKSKSLLTVKLIPQAIEIINKYIDKSNPENYIFPIIQHEDRSYIEYKNAMRLINKKLKKIGLLVNTSIPLTTYVARHSWATIAKRSGISTAIISEGMGHETEKVTQVYLDSFENDVVDKANEIITSLI